jgi:hypothetical protein
MTLPAILFGIVLSSVYGTAFHFMKGGGLNKLILFVALAWVGFWTGHFVGGWVGWTFAAIGPLHGGMATLGSAIFLFGGEWLSRVEVNQK